MKTNFIRLFLVVGILALAYSCRPTENNIMQTEIREFEQKYFLTDDKTKGVLTVNMQVELPVKFHNANILENVRNQIVEAVFGFNYVQFSNRELLSRFAAGLSEEYKDNNLPFFTREMSEEIGYAFNNDFLLETFVMLSDERIFSYGIDLYVYMGGAHGLSTRTFLNFDLRNGDLIFEENLFFGDYEAVLTEIMKQKIIAQNPEINSVEDLEEIFWTENIRPNGNFFITDEAINYVFNPYEIAPFVFGHTEISILFDEIREILKNP